MYIPFKRLHPAAKPPTQAHDGADAGYDLYALDDPDTHYWMPLHPGHRRLFRTGIALSLPKGYFGCICDRSGNALKRGLHVLGGIVDSGYQGDVGVILLNTSQDAVWVEAGERIAQLIIKRHESVEFIDVGDSPLEQSARGASGFGSTGG